MDIPLTPFRISNDLLEEGPELRTQGARRASLLQGSAGSGSKVVAVPFRFGNFARGRLHLGRCPSPTGGGQHRAPLHRRGCQVRRRLSQGMEEGAHQAPRQSGPDCPLPMMKVPSAP